MFRAAAKRFSSVFTCEMSAQHTCCAGQTLCRRAARSWVVSSALFTSAARGSTCTNRSARGWSSACSKSLSISGSVCAMMRKACRFGFCVMDKDGLVFLAGISRCRVAVRRRSKWYLFPCFLGEKSNRPERRIRWMILQSYGISCVENAYGAKYEQKSCPRVWDSDQLTLSCFVQKPSVLQIIMKVFFRLGFCFFSLARVKLFIRPCENIHSPEWKMSLARVKTTQRLSL